MIGDRVVATKNIKTVSAKTGNVQTRGIPNGTLGTIIAEENTQRFGRTISVEFDNGKIGSFGDSLNEGLDFINKNPKDERTPDVAATLENE